MEPLIHVKALCCCILFVAGQRVEFHHTLDFWCQPASRANKLFFKKEKKQASRAITIIIQEGNPNRSLTQLYRASWNLPRDLERNDSSVILEAKLECDRERPLPFSRLHQHQQQSNNAASHPKVIQYATGKLQQPWTSFLLLPSSAISNCRAALVCDMIVTFTYRTFSPPVVLHEKYWPTYLELADLDTGSAVQQLVHYTTCTCDGIYILIRVGLDKKSNSSSLSQNLE